MREITSILPARPEAAAFGNFRQCRARHHVEWRRPLRQKLRMRGVSLEHCLLCLIAAIGLCAYMMLRNVKIALWSPIPIVVRPHLSLEQGCRRGEQLRWWTS